MIWLVYFPAIVIVMILCHITNPVAVLFADEVGELHGFWKYWQTWDDTLDSKYMMTEVVPNKWYRNILDYDWASKYESYQDTGTLAEYGYVIEKVRLRPGATFSFKEKVQRYFCRWFWLLRNCAYGFAFSVFSAKGNIEDISYVKNAERDDAGNYFYFAWDKTRNILVRPWACKFSQHIAGPLHVAGYLGWKIPVWHTNGKYVAMIANRVVPRFHAD